MAIPNIVVVLLLSGMIARETRHYVYDGNLDEPDDAPSRSWKGSSSAEARWRIPPPFFWARIGIYGNVRRYVSRYVA